MFHFLRIVHRVSLGNGTSVSNFFIGATAHYLIFNHFNIAAYFSQKKLESLATIDTISGIGNIPVPEGLFRSGRTGKGRRQDSDPTRSAGSHIPPLISVQVGSSSRAPHSQDPPSFSAFRSSSPDAAIREFRLLVELLNTASHCPRFRISVPDSWQLPTFYISDHEHQSSSRSTTAFFSLDGCHRTFLCTVTVPGPIPVPLSLLQLTIAHYTFTSFINVCKLEPDHNVFSCRWGQPIGASRISGERLDATT